MTVQPPPSPPADRPPAAKVNKPRVVAVEGGDDSRFLERMLSHMGEMRVQVMNIGGKGNLSAYLATIRADAVTSGVDLSFIGVVRDADDDKRSAFQAACAALSSNALPIPAAPGEIASGSPSTAVLILPADRETGSLEDLVWESVRDQPAARCVEGYIACLKRTGAMESHKEGKARVHAYLASKNDPAVSVGLAADKGYWPLDSLAFDSIRRFIKLVAEHVS